MLIINHKLSKCFLAILCLLIVFTNGCVLSEINKKKSRDLGAKEESPPIKKMEIENLPSAEQGSGYLVEGSTISLGIIDGDEELKVLNKIKRLESRLAAERKTAKALEEKLSKLQAAKEGVEKDYADTRKKLEERNKVLSDEIKAMELKLRETETRAVTAEQALNPLKKELLKSQISETKAQQELYKLKIENIKQVEE